MPKNTVRYCLRGGREKRTKNKADEASHRARATGYETFFPNVGDYELKGAPASWTKVVAMRHAMTLFPDATYLWYLDLDAFIMNPQLSVEQDVMAAARLEERMMLDHPVVPPDSIIHTFSHLRGEDIDFVVTQDRGGLSTASFLLRNSEWSRYFLETWFDPIYRSYNFQKAETHALVSDSRDDFALLSNSRAQRPRQLTRQLTREYDRSTLSNGTRPSCRSSPWCRSGLSTPTPSRIVATSTRRATSRFDFPAALSLARTQPATQTRSRLRWSGGQLTGVADVVSQLTLPAALLLH